MALPEQQQPQQPQPQQQSNGHTNGKAGHVRYIPLDYDGSDPDSAMRLVMALRPEWQGEKNRVEFVRFTDGITNTLLKAVNRREGLTKEEVDTDAVLLRAYGHGTQVLIDRQRETQNHELLMRYGLAPELLARFHNGMLYRYIRGRPTAPDDLRRPRIYRAVARRLAEWHATVPCLPKPITDGDKKEEGPHTHSNGNSANGANGVNGSSSNGNGAVCSPYSSIDYVAPGKPPPNVWTVMQKWLLALPTETEVQRERQALLQAELKRLIQDLSQRPGLGKNGLVFAHCDLLSGNVIVEPKDGHQQKGACCQEDEEESVNFIDYEYATPSPAAFDLSNHFAEWGGFDCDYNVLPTRAQRLEFIREYIHSYFDLLPSSDEDDQQSPPITPTSMTSTTTNGEDSNGHSASNTNGRSQSQGGSVGEEAEVARMFEEVDMFRGVPGFYWGIWSLIQAQISQIDFDYASYAEIRLGEYWAWRDEMSGARAARGEDMPLREKRWAQEK